MKHFAILVNPTLLYLKFQWVNKAQEDYKPEKNLVDQSLLSRYEFHRTNEENNRVSCGLWFSNNFIPTVILTVFTPSTWMLSLITEFPYNNLY